MNDTGSTDFQLDTNGPGDYAGETNGLYSGVTINPTDTGYYLDQNPGDVTTDTTGAGSALASIAQGLSSAYTANRQAAATSSQQAYAQQLAMAKLAKPSLLQQWNAMGLFAQLGVVATILALAIYMKKA